MFPLAGAALPTSPETLVETLRAGLAAHGIHPANLAAAGAWPQLDSLAFDLTGISLEAAQSLPHPGTGRDGGFSAAEFTLRAAPAQFRDMPVEIAISARDARFVFAPDDAAPAVLLTGAADGEVSVAMALPALEQLLHRLAADAAREHGVEVRQTRLKITQRGPRAISLDAEVTAKAFIATATVTISGDADLDERLVARLSNLRMGGEGMIANLAGGVIRPVLARLEGKELPLLGLAGDVKLRDVQVEVGEMLRIAAQFGG